MNKSQDALISYNRAIQLKPNNAEVIDRYSQLLLK